MDLPQTRAGRPTPFEIDGANAASAFLHEHDLPEDSVGAVWDAVALHTTFGIPAYKRPEISLLQSGVVLDVLGFGFDEIPIDTIRVDVSGTRRIRWWSPLRS